MSIQPKSLSDYAKSQINKIQKNKDRYTKETQSFKSGSLSELFKAAEHEPQFLLEPFLREGEATLIYAASGLGKSFYAAGLAVAMASGGEFIGYKAPEPRKVKYIDGEMSVYDLSLRIKAAINDDTNEEALFKNLSISSREAHTDQYNQFPDISDKSFKSKIVRELIDEGVEVVIFDNFSTLALSLEDENAAGGFNGTLEILLALKSVGILPILVHHATKAGGTYRGTSKMEAVFSNIIGLHRDKEVDPKIGCGFSIKFDKNRSLHNKLTEVRAVQYQKDDGCWIELESSITKIQVILDALQSLEYVSQEEMAVGLGWGKSTVSKWLNRAYASGDLTEKEKDRLFDLAQQERDREMYEIEDGESDF